MQRLVGGVAYQIQNKVDHFAAREDRATLVDARARHGFNGGGNWAKVEKGRLLDRNWSRLCCHSEQPCLGVCRAAPDRSDVQERHPLARLRQIILQLVMEPEMRILAKSR